MPGFVRIKVRRGKAGSVTDVALPAANFFIGRTLVTVQQFEAFIEDDGYGDDSLWDADGLAWRMGGFDGATTAAVGSMSLRPIAQRRLPWRWFEQRPNPTRPVVGIGWFEARAFAAWLDRLLRPELSSAGLSAHRVRLPIEIEWEMAVRARNLQQVDDRDLPWDDVRVSFVGVSAIPLANIDAARLGHVNAVGLFPPNPIGLHDLAGNVWEWMDNLQPPPDGSARRIESAAPLRYLNGQISAQPGVSLRGGSWQSSLDEARCGVRVSRMPWEHDDTIGLRVALVPPSSTTVA